MDVTDVLRDRMDEPSGLQYMAAVSIAAHVVVFGAFMLAPGALLLSHTADDPARVMTITLSGGGDGPQNGGLTPMGGRPVQAQTPPDAPREAVRPPAAAAPAMTVPTPGAKPAKSAAPVKQAPDGARGRTPTKGEETRAGSTVAVTGARGEGFGLSSGGGPGSGSRLDVADFCCPDYLVTMVTRIKSNWSERQNISGLVIIKFTIRRDGTLEDISLEQSSGFPIADLNAQRAVTLTRQLPPLPDAFPNPTLTVHLNFQYQR
jgi:TonB family protein